MPSKPNLTTIVLLTILVLSNLIWAGVFYNKFTYQKPNEVVAQSQQKLNSIDVELPSIKYDYYKLQNPEAVTKLSRDMDKVKKIVQTVNQEIESVSTSTLKESTAKNITEFQSQTKDFVQNKKEMDCIIKVYEESSAGQKLYSYPYSDPEVTTPILETMIADATKCGTIIAEDQKTTIVKSYKNMLEQSKIFSDKQRSLSIEKGNYDQKIMQESERLSQEYSKNVNQFSDAIIAPIKQKYQPIVDYVESLKTIVF
jgi:hypothetical protein